MCCLHEITLAKKAGTIKRNRAIRHTHQSESERRGSLILFLHWRDSINLLPIICQVLMLLIVKELGIRLLQNSRKQLLPGGQDHLRKDRLVACRIEPRVRAVSTEHVARQPEVRR